MNNKKRENLIAFTSFSLLLAIEIIVCFTPLGTLPALGSLNATLSHIPVIICAVIMGARAGAGMGFVFGACSFIYWSFVNPGVYSFIYTPFYKAGEYGGNFFSLLICFVPRILIGVVCALVFAALKKAGVNKKVSAGIAGAAGSLTNTILVLGGVALFFGKEYSALTADSGKALYYILGTTVVFNGLPEAFLGAAAAALIAVPVSRAIKKEK